MNFDDLKSQWVAYDAAVQSNLKNTLNVAAGWQKANSALQRLSRSVVIEMIIGLLTLAVLGGFLFDYYQEPAFFLPGLILHLFTIFQVAASGYQFAKLKELDFSAPVLASQMKLARLRRLRIRVVMWTLILSPLLWIPLLVVGMKGLLGVNVYALLNSTWLIANVLFGLAFIPAMVALSRYFGPRWQGSALVKSVMDHIAGDELKAMTAFLKSLEQFEPEDA